MDTRSYAVSSGQSPLGELQAVLPAPRLLLLRAPQAAGGVILVPFGAIEWIDIVSREIHLLPGHDTLEEAMAVPRDGSRAEA